MMRNDFAVFIITHGRAYNQKTLKALTDAGYTGALYLIVDDQDSQQYEYRRLYPDNVIVFNKQHFIDITDSGLCNPVAKFAVFARNAVENFARNTLKLKYFLVLDDDITRFRYRYDVDGSLKTASVSNIDAILDACIEYVEYARLACLSFGVCNVYRSGVEAVREWRNSYRFCVNCFLRNADIKVEWRLNMLEDLITVLDSSISGNTWLTFVPIQADIPFFNGKSDGGNSETYRTFDGAKMNFMPVLVHPSCNKLMYYTDHWKPLTSTGTSVPLIVSAKYKKVGV